MADLEKTVKVIFSGEDKELSSAMSGISAQFGELDKSAQKMAEPLDALGKNILKADAALLAMVAGGMALAIKESANFNQGFALISTSIDATGADLEKYRQSILDYSTTSVRSITDINASLYTAAQAGIKWGDSLEFIGKAEQLAVANKADLNKTVDLLTGTMNAYGFTISDVGHMNDVFFTSTLIGKQTIDELAQSMGQVVGIAANAGVSFEELSAGIATLTAKGMDTEAAITAMKAVITTIVSPSKEAAAAAAELGLNFSLSELNARGFSGILADIMLKTGGSKEKMAELFNEVRAMNGIFMLAGDGGAFFNKALDQTVNSAGNAGAEYQKMVVTFQNQTQIIKNVLTNLLIEVGTLLEPMAAQVGGAFADMFKGIKIGVESGAFDPLFNYLDEVSESIASWLEQIGESFPEAFRNLDLSKLTESLQDVLNWFKETGGQITTTDLTRAIQDIADTIGSLISVTKGMAEPFVPILEMFREAVNVFNNLDNSTKELAGNLVGLGMAYKMFGPWSILLIALGQDAEGVGNKFQFFASAVENGVLTIKLALYILAEAFAYAALGAAMLQDAMPFVDASDEVAKATALVDSFGKKIDETTQDIVRTSGIMSNAWNGTQRDIENTGDAAGNLKESINSIPAERSTKITADTEDGTRKIGDLADKLKEIPPNKSVDIGVQADGASIEKAYGMIIETFPDGQISITNIGVKADGASITATKEAIDKELPKDKAIEVQLKIDEARMREQSAIIQKSIEWTAKVDIANIEAATKQIEAAFKSVTATVEDTGKVMTSLAGTYATLVQAGQGGTSFIEQMIEDESERRDAALDLQKELTHAEINNLEARTKAMEGGKALIEINGAGLQPHLEAFMFEILKAIQVRATAEGAKFLTGV